MKKISELSTKEVNERLDFLRDTVYSGDMDIRDMELLLEAVKGDDPFIQSSVKKILEDGYERAQNRRKKR